jgi:hypothetical protein
VWVSPTYAQSQVVSDLDQAPSREIFGAMLIWKITVIISFLGLIITSILVILVWRSGEKFDRLYIVVPMLFLALGGLIQGLSHLR